MKVINRHERSPYPSPTSKYTSSVVIACIETMHFKRCSCLWFQHCYAWHMAQQRWTLNIVILKKLFTFNKYLYENLLFFLNAFLIYQ